MLPTYLRSGPLGVLIGAMPGVGATTASFVSYSTAVRFSKEPEKFGTGIPEGIAAPETANNAAAMGAMVPLLSLGIPGYVLEKYKYPIAPIVIGLVLGQLFEQEFRRALVISHGSPMIFLTSPIATPIIAVSLLIVLVPVFRRLWRRLSISKAK